MLSLFYINEIQLLSRVISASNRRSHSLVDIIRMFYDAFYYFISVNHDSVHF